MHCPQKASMTSASLEDHSQHHSNLALVRVLASKVPEQMPYPHFRFRDSQPTTVPKYQIENPRNNSGDSG